MVILRKWQLIWFFSLLILLEAIWIDFRLDKLKSQTSKDFFKIQRGIISALKKIPEPKIEDKLIGDGELWLEPKEASFSGFFTLQIWAKASAPVEKIDLRLFYPKDLLEVIDTSWQADNGVAFWSSKTTPLRDRGREFLVKTISFQVLKPGEAGIEFDFSKESLLDCNLLDEQGEDVLEKVVDSTYTLL